ncbi:MAG TPA: flagellar motor protein MotB [Bryobacteraceae bacterium]|nr:flagellar motor protein MotB [Bryobacteraceae bacterium]
MARKKPEAEHANHERWLVSYADFITLLFAFFVVMFASSQTDKAKAQMVSDSVKQALEKGGVSAAVREILGGTVDDRGKGNALMRGPGGSQPIDRHDTAGKEAELVPSMQYLTQALAAEIHNGKIEIHLEPRGLVVSLREAAFFPSGGDTVDPNTFAPLDKIAATLRELPNGIRLEGHTDSVPIHTARFRSNWELSAARSIAMLDLFASRGGVNPQRLAIAGYADTIPVDSNDTVEGRAHNRRVDIVILAQRVQVKATAEPEPRAPSKPAHK